MYALDHSPPHFHAEYSGHEALVSIDELSVVRGRLPTRARRLVIEWASLHESELRQAWERSRRLEPLGKIAPLD